MCDPSVTLLLAVNPNYGAASGGYFTTVVKVPHGHSEMYTTKLVMHMPRGILSVKPEVPAGWNATVITYDLAPEDRYTSHGNQVTQGPDKVIFTAESADEALHNDHLMNIALQLKLGCSFRDAVGSDYSGSNSIWGGQHTIWFKMEQYTSPPGSLANTMVSLWVSFPHPAVHVCCITPSTCARASLE